MAGVTAASGLGRQAGGIGLKQAWLQPKRILVVLMARFGDTLTATPALAALKAHYPAAQLEVVAHPQRGQVLQGLGFIDRVRLLPKWRLQLGRWWPWPRYDLGVVFGHSRVEIQFARRHCRWLVGEPQQQPELAACLDMVQTQQAPIHIVQDRLRVLSPLGVQPQGLACHYRVTASEQAQAQAWLQQQLPRCQRPLIGLQLSSFPTKAYRDWPLASWLALAQRILNQWPEAGIVLLGGGESSEKAATLLAQLPQRVASAVAAFDFRHNAALIDALDLYVGPDTGPTHLRGALGKPMVGLYHHVPQLLQPLEHPALQVIAHPQAQQPGEHAMSDISVEQVWQACLRLLEPVHEQRSH